jgi:hypothetical protein
MPNDPNFRSGFWRIVLARLKTLSTTLGPLFGWIYLFLASYVILGSLIFPEWWRRFLLDGGVLDSRYWSMAGEYLVNLAKIRHPLGIIVILLGLLLVGWLIFTAGRVGIANVPKKILAPSGTSILPITIILLVTLGALAALKTEYKTPAESSAELDRASERAHRSVYDLFRPKAPKSGFFLYLDPPRLAKTYNTLQNELTIASETKTEETGTEVRGTVSLKGIGGEAISRDRVERSIKLIPTTPTPERQAQWLIHTYSELNLDIDLPDESVTESWASREAREALAERNVNLSSEQLARLAEGDAELLERKLSQPNTPLLYKGKIHLRDQNGVLLSSFKTGGGANVNVAAEGSTQFLDTSVHSCAKTENGCHFQASILGIVWRTVRQERNINLEVALLALW